MEFVPLLALSALVLTVINWLKYLKSGDWNGVYTQLAVWLAGVLAVLLVAETDWAGTLAFGDIVLGDMNVASKVFLGLSIGAVASAGHEALKSFDNTDSAHKADLFGSSTANKDN